MELVSHPQLCHHSVTSGMLNMSTSRLVCVYQTLVLSVLLHASKTWTILVRNIESFHMTCWRRILRIRWHDFIQKPRCPCAQVYHLCQTRVWENGMSYSVMWRGYQTALWHRTCYAKFSPLSANLQIQPTSTQSDWWVPPHQQHYLSDFLETSCRSWSLDSDTTFQDDCALTTTVVT